MQSTVRWYWGTGLMSLQELPHPCQLCEWVSYHALVSQHLPGGVGFVYLLLHVCMEQDLICLGGTSVWYVLTTFLSVTMVAVLAARKNYRVFINTEKCGGGYISLSLFVLQPSIKLSVRCSSHTTSLLTCCSCDVMWCRNTWIINKKMSAKSGRNILTIAASSRMMTCVTGVAELSCTGTRSSKQPPRSESTSCSSEAATSRALLYNVTRHWVWYLASYVIMSLAF